MSNLDRIKLGQLVKFSTFLSLISMDRQLSEHLRICVVFLKLSEKVIELDR